MCVYSILPETYEWTGYAVLVICPFTWEVRYSEQSCKTDHSHPGTEVIFHIYQLFTKDAGLAIKSEPRAKYKRVLWKHCFYKQGLKVSFVYKYCNWTGRKTYTHSYQTTRNIIKRHDYVISILNHITLQIYKKMSDRKDFSFLWVSQPLPTMGLLV